MCKLIKYKSNIVNILNNPTIINTIILLSLAYILLEKTHPYNPLPIKLLKCKNVLKIITTKYL